MESRGATAPRLSEMKKYNSCGKHEEPGTCRHCLATADVPAPERTQTSGRLPNSSKALAQNVACACDAGNRSRRDLVSMKNALAKPSTRPATSAECFVMRDDALPLPLWRPRGVGERRRDCFRSFAAAIWEKKLSTAAGMSEETLCGTRGATAGNPQIRPRLPRAVELGKMGDGTSDGVLNINVGIMGHVDSGKTSLARALSTIVSTAGLDKHPQSQERGITLDLGFSSFQVPLPDHIREAAQQYQQLQFTLVDCPGHASLIRTIIGGAQIIDLMMLVIDVTKGVQTQTAECLVVGEILMNHLIVVLNKTDMIPPDERDAKIAKTKAGLAKVFAGTKFKDPVMIPVSATGGSADPPAPVGLTELIDALRAAVYLPPRNPDGALLLSVDHCFPIKGKGTVLTGTVLRGTIKVNDDIELPEFKVTKKVKSMQMFRKSVAKASQGDRVAALVTQLDADKIERAIVCAPGSIPTFSAAVIRVERVRFFKGACPSKRKFHMTVGHTTVMATANFFVLPPAPGVAAGGALEAGPGKGRETALDLERDYLLADELLPTGKDAPVGSQWAIVVLEKPVTAPLDSLLIYTSIYRYIYIYIYSSLSLSIHQCLDMYIYIHIRTDACRNDTHIHTYTYR